MDAVERRNKELETDLHKISTQYKVLMEKGVSQREVDQRFAQLEVDYRTLQNKHQLAEEQLAKVHDQKIDSDKRCEALRREVDVLAQDKNYLTRDNSNLEDKLKRIQDKLDRTEEELLEAKKTASKYMERVLSSNDDLKSKFDQQYSQQITELKERHAKELDCAKQNLVELYEKRVEFAKERKDELE